MLNQVLCVPHDFFQILNAIFIFPAARILDDIILESRGEAEDVLERMDELIATYQLVSVADFYDLVGVSGNYTDNKYGWTDIRNASVIRVRDGYMIKLPKALPLN